MNAYDRLKKFREFKDGWHGEGSLAPSHEGLAWLETALKRASLPSPYVYPTYEGEVRFEWTFTPKEASLVVNLETKQGLWDWTNTEVEEGDDQTLDLNLDENWAYVAEALQMLSSY